MHRKTNDNLIGYLLGDHRRRFFLGDESCNFDGFSSGTKVATLKFCDEWVELDRVLCSFLARSIRTLPIPALPNDAGLGWKLEGIQGSLDGLQDSARG